MLEASLMVQGLRIYLQCKRLRRLEFQPPVREISWKQEPTPVCAWEILGQRSLASCSPCVTRVGQDRVTAPPQLCITNAFPGKKEEDSSFQDSFHFHIWGGMWSVSVVAFSSCFLLS